MRREIKGIIFIILLLIGIKIPYSLAFNQPTIVYVDDDFDESTPGWGYDHFASIQDGINAVAEGGTVYVYEGIYNELILIKKPLNLIGEDKEKVIIDGNGLTDDTIRITGDNVFISDFTIRRAGKFYAGITIYSRNVNISNCKITMCENIGVKFYEYSSNSILFNCNISKNTIGIFMEDFANNIQIKKCLISDNEYYGLISQSGYNVQIIGCYISYHSYGIALLCGAKDNIIENCNFSHNVRGLYLSSQSFSSEIKNNIFLDNTIALKLDSTYKNKVHHCIFINNENEIILEYAYLNFIYKNDFYPRKFTGVKFINSPLNFWLNNYWNNWRLPLPKPIFGIYLFIPWLSFDWLPSLQENFQQNQQAF